MNKKLLATLLTVTTLSAPVTTLGAQLVPVATPTAVAINNYPTLTVAEATQRAINNSRNLSNTQDTVTQLEEQQQRMRQSLWDMPSVPQHVFLDMQVGMMQLDAGRAASLSGITAQRETMTFVVTSLFNSIMQAQNELALFERNLDIIARDLTAVRLMQELGMASTVQLDQLLTQQRMAEHNHHNLTLSLEASFRELSRLMGNRNTNTYNLVFEPAFNSVADINLDHYIRLHQNNNMQIENAQRQLDIAEFERDNMGLRFDPMTGVVQQNVPTRVERDITVNQRNREVATAREQVEHNIIDLHNDLLGLEIAIGSMELQLGLLEHSLSIQELQYSVGQITRLELDRASMAVYELQEQIRRLKANHYLLSMPLTNPNILF